MKLVVVTVNYGAARHVLHALEALVPQLEALGEAEAWVVDNRSPDDSVAVLRAAIAERGWGGVVRLLESPVNGGFGAGNNLAFRRGLALPSPPEVFYLLNPDATPDPGAVAAMLDFLERHPEVGVAGGRLRDPDGSTQCSTFRFPTLWSELEGHAQLAVLSRLLRDRRVHLDPPTREAPVDWVSGASMMIRREVLLRAGLFDENFFLYFEEVDLCRRVREAGYGIWFVPGASVEHLSGVTTGVGDRRRRVPRYWFESRSHYHRKTSGELGLWAYHAVALLGACLHRLRELVGRKAFEKPHFVRDLLRTSFLPGGRAP